MPSEPHRSPTLAAPAPGRKKLGKDRMQKSGLNRFAKWFSSHKFPRADALELGGSESGQPQAVEAGGLVFNKVLDAQNGARRMTNDRVCVGPQPP